MIIKHCKKIGLNYILRPKNLSSDTSDVFNTAIHALKFLEEKGEIFDIVILAQPTSPFVDTNIFDKMIKFMRKNSGYSSCQTIHETPHNYHYLNTRLLNNRNKTVNFKFKNLRGNKTNKQKKEKTFSFGNLIATRVNKLFKTKIFSANPHLE